MTEVSISGQLAELAAKAAGCTSCRLSSTRTKVVFADGDPTADLMFIGEGPGYYEDREGVPFVGRAGSLLDRLLVEVGLNRQDVYIANVVKCRPPGNRDPRPDEIEACKHFLVNQIRLVDPAVVMTLGNFATKLLLKTSMGITRTRGTVYPWWNRVVVPTFHPAAALRSGPAMTETIKGDLELAVREIRRRRDEAPTGENQTADTVTEPVDTPPEQLGLFE